MEPIFRNTGLLWYSLTGTSAFLIFFALVACPVMGQGTQKGTLEAADYKLWSSLQLNAISDDGAWVAYGLGNEEADTVFVTRTDGKKTYPFPEAAKGQFVGYHTYLSLDKGGVLRMLDLRDGGARTFGNIKKFEVVANFIMTLSTGASPILKVLDRNGVASFEAGGVADFKTFSGGQYLAFVSSGNDGHAVSLYDIDKKSTQQITINPDVPYSRPEWSADGQSLVFLSGAAKGIALHHYNLTNGKLSVLEQEKLSLLLPGMQLENRALKTSGDGSMVYFNIKDPEPIPADAENAVEVWNAADQWIYPAEQEIDGWRVAPKLALWEPQGDRVLQLTDNRFPRGYVTADDAFAVTYNPQVHEPQFAKDSRIAYYLTNLRNGDRDVWLTGDHDGGTDIMLSPNGKHISYFSDGHWQVYDIASGAHHTATAKITHPLSDVGYDRLGAAPAYGSPGWTKDGKWLLVYDQFDLWKVSADGLVAKRLTRGREQNISFRIVVQRAAEKIAVERRGFTSGSFDMHQGIVLKGIAKDLLSFGYYSYTSDKALKQLARSGKKLEHFTRSANGKNIVYIEQSNNVPPRLIIQNGNKKKILLQSNPQHYYYFSSGAELISFSNSKGQPLKGILYYPAHYDPERKYPMVVHVYEKQSNQWHDYINPSLYAGDGFNAANLAAKGFFVFQPDIVYDAGKPGASALDCVESGVKTVLSKGMVDSTKIGLIGHSFGGFETVYIASHSRMFKCAVAGAAMTDLISGSYSLWSNAKRPNYIKMETGQARMSKTLFEDREMYLDNSPVLYAGTIDIPLFSWTGGDDPQVDPSQSFELYFAMRRLAKEHILLVYPGEGHGLFEKKNKADLTSKVESWFDYHLKDAVRPEWTIAR